MGPSGFFLSYLGAWKFLFHATDVLQDGYANYKGIPFKIADIHNWIVIISGRQLIEELRRAPDDALSGNEALNDIVKVEYTLGSGIRHNPYHLPIVRTQLTRNLATQFLDIQDEIATAFDDVLPIKNKDWVKLPAFNAIMDVISRASSRVFVGLPLCRDHDWRSWNIQFALDIAYTALTLKIFPKFMTPYVIFPLTDTISPMFRRRLIAKCFTCIPADIARGMNHLGPIIKERQRYLDEFGSEWADKPNDLLSWLMDEAQGEERSIRSLTLRVYAISFAAIHTSSTIFTHALFQLAANPQYVQPLREEVMTIVEKEGWSKAAMAKMHKVDSFIKEVLRFVGTGSLAMHRKALKDFTFSDGTFIPAGTLLAVPSIATHHDGETYENPGVFDPFRFAHLQTEKGQEIKRRMVSVSADCIAFGYGRHACPGRFFAATVLKTMMAHIVVTYDVKMEKEGVVPDNQTFSFSTFPHPEAEVMFRRRSVS
ncbi:hypothetical protein SERLA73DRAFT_77211 [Serpula lacrymans var. lacrymans S7.3]|uniref:Cytochrome P450 n=2 Tax=Serpula lacrymans var. lacrymans TaxID=341189 RepID=F8Q9E8_SERL3|nr:uncharacterized protein SERLADRAFT_442067 [Serpula lacrymans var. lacrymans S7.9]EGN95203.1 hypothetical protein SERLA73DRAFT_77211 [Serpula lacrymans var. lacrymans S7.3]EGO20731.1 hypothetical protein SERLADRAFT_442067 [Serpula lacrymans var. lacrymans S7.9]